MPPSLFTNAFKSLVSDLCNDVNAVRDKTIIFSTLEKFPDEAAWEALNKGQAWGGPLIGRQSMERTHLPTLSGDGIGLRPMGGSSRKARMKPHATILGQPSWRIRSETVEAYVTRLGGQLAPVTFDRRGRRIQPYAVAPWVTEKLDKSTSGIIRALRGDFFCMPFGANQTPFRG